MPQYDLFAQRAAGPRVQSVTELTREIKGLLEGRLGAVWVKGEVSNLRQPGSGHLYFTLKDSESCIDAVLFRTQARLVKWKPQNGLSVLVKGQLTVYGPQGRYQVVCDSLEPLGAGALQLAFEQLKEKLAAEGLFDRARKRPLPFIPRRIALVTSPSGAVVHDFLRVLHRRFPNLSVVVVPARVQGEGAAQEIARGIHRASGLPSVDLVVVARGGGSLEDLWPFNEEVVARALAACPVPTVSAVGHEVDVTIADFVADVRAPTPTAAAELVAREKEELSADLANKRSRLYRALRSGLGQRIAQLETRRAKLADPRRWMGDKRLQLDRFEQRGQEAQTLALQRRQAELRALSARLSRQHPQAALHRYALEVGRLRERMAAQVHRALAARRQAFQAAAGKLDALSPLKVLSRGYAIAFDAQGHALTDAAALSVGQPIVVRLSSGQVSAEITSVSPQSPKRET